MSQRSKTAGGGREGESPAATDSYWNASRRPLEILVFLAPFIALYEIGLVHLLREDRGTITNLAHEWMVRFMGVFYDDLLGLTLPAVVVVTVLLLWQILSRNPWRVSPRVLGLMLIEALLLVLPLLMLSRLVQQHLPLLGGEERLLADLGPLARIAMSIGAGLYEEFVFRMLVVFVIHTVVVDVLRFPGAWGTAIAVLCSALLFTIYHPVWGEDGTASVRRIAFYLLAGLWFGVLYVLRGFGIVVAVHAFYDMVILLDGD